MSADVMFIWNVQAILRAFEQYQPALHAQLSEAMFLHTPLQPRIPHVFPQLPKISINYAIMEKANNVVVISAEFGWDDLGDWNAMERLLKGEGDNVSVGRHVGIDTGGAILHTRSGDDLIATIGLEDVVGMRAGDVTLFVWKDRTQDIKQVVQQLKSHPELERFA
ncbi:hypothetical protein GCM10008960_23690 [Deinococcus sedimenti]|uniref:MannoseP isomerase/GMP-like beta-helix domain-containing protein n=1 Tax=Deinococcus sedimenti TaxID=1867090 RepID=A0ABQ2S464_9DEIO|nr:hypothetical protein [Deinococcus sedimenti]GGR96113.1 hypothetical protein GCM10008960_23690 [Deinococcus sedimenti]